MKVDFGPTAEKRRSSRWLGDVWLVAGLLALSLALAMGFHQAIQHAAAAFREILEGPRNLAAEEASLRRDGIPVTAAELRARLPHVAPADNAAPLWVKLDKPLAALANSRDPAAKLLFEPRALDSASPAERQAARALLARNKPLLDRVLAAARKPHAQFNINWEDLNNAHFRQFATFRQAAQLLASASTLLEQERRYDEAIRMQAQGFRIAGQSMDDPALLLSLVVGMHLDTVTLDGTKRLLNDGDGRDAAAIYSTVTQNRPRLDPSRAYWGEGLLDDEIIHALVEKPELLHQFAGEPTPNPNPLHAHTPLARLFFSDIMAASGARTLQLLHLFVQDARLPTCQERAAFARTHHIDVAGLRRRFDSGSMMDVLPVILLYPPNWTLEAKAAATEEVTLSGAAVLEYRAHHGQFPERLQDAGIHSTDPFSGQALRYRREGKGFVIFSVGPTGKFDPDAAGARAQDNRSLWFRYTRGKPAAGSP